MLHHQAVARCSQRGFDREDRAGGPRRWSSLFLLLAASSAISCASAKKVKQPYVVAAEEKDAQSQIRRLKERWELSSTTAKKDLRSELEEFLRRHEGDPSADEARLMLAQLSLMERRYVEATALLQPLLSGRRGRMRDEAELVMASVEIRRGQLDEGLRRLAPLEGKLLSRSAEEMFYRERISAAIEARRWRLAVDSMKAWLKRRDDSGLDTKRWIEQALLTVPPKALFRILLPEGTDRIEEPTDEEERYLQRVMIQRIASESLAQHDARLARDLVQSAPPWLKTGEQGEALLRLSALAQNAAHITGRSLGFILGGGSEIARARNLRVASGVLAAIAKSRSTGASIEYVTAEDSGSTAGALGALSGMGATYVVGGVDEASARAALVFAQARGVPTVTMVAPRVLPAPSEFGFVAGVSDEEQVDALKRAFPHDEDGITIGGDQMPCADVSRQTISSRLSSASPLILFLGDARCLHLTMTAAHPFRDQLKWGIGLENAAGPFPSAGTVHILRAGGFPVASRTEPPLSASDVESTRDWYFSLGFDVAQLLIRALLELPEQAVSDLDQVRAFHQKAALVLARTKAPLLTTESRGFDESRRLPRQLLTAELVLR